MRYCVGPHARGGGLCGTYKIRHQSSSPRHQKFKVPHITRLGNKADKQFCSVLGSCGSSRLEAMDSQDGRCSRNYWRPASIKWQVPLDERNYLQALSLEIALTQPPTLVHFSPLEFRSHWLLNRPRRQRNIWKTHDLVKYNNGSRANFQACTIPNDSHIPRELMRMM